MPPPFLSQWHKALEEDGQEVVAASLESMRKLELPAPLCYRPRLKRRCLANYSFKLVNHMWWFEAFIAYSLVSATVSPSPFMVVAPPWCPAAGLDVEEEQDVREKASMPVAA